MAFQRQLLLLMDFVVFSIWFQIVCVVQHDYSDVSSATSKSTMKHTARLALSEFDQLVTSFAYCYDNELRPWCGSTAAPAVHTTLGPTLKHVHTPLEQLVNVCVCVRVRSYFVLNCYPLYHCGFCVGSKLFVIIFLVWMSYDVIEVP